MAFTKATRRALRTKREIARGERHVVEEHEPEMTAEEIATRGAASRAAHIARLTQAHPDNDTAFNEGPTQETA